MAYTIAVTDNFYLPKRSQISSITRALDAVITTTTDHDLISGEIVRIVVPQSYGMPQIDNQIGTITVINDTSFMIDIDTVEYDAFIVPSNVKQFAQVVPIAEINSTTRAAVRNILRGSNE